MQPNNATIVLLVIVLAVLNGKEIIEYIQWLRFKIRIYFKQMQNNERKN
jgi:hypothetical protein